MYTNDYESVGSILPGYVGTDEALEAMNQAKGAMASLNALVVYHLCGAGAGSNWLSQFLSGQTSTVNCKHPALFASWGAFVNEVNGWYDRNSGFFARWVNPNARYNEAQKYKAQVVQWRGIFSSYGVPVGMAPPPQVEQEKYGLLHAAGKGAQNFTLETAKTLASTVLIVGGVGLAGLFAYNYLKKRG